MPRKSTPSYKTSNSTFAKRLTEAMKDRGENQTTLAEKITAQYVTIQRQTISLYMNGQSKPDTERLTAIAKALDVSADWLLGLAEEKTSNMDVRSICRYTGLSEEIVKHLMHCQGFPQSDGFAQEQEMPYPINPETPSLEAELLNKLFPPERLHGIAVELCGCLHRFDYIKKEIETEEGEISSAIESGDEYRLEVFRNHWTEKFYSTMSVNRLLRFEAIEALTRLFDKFYKNERMEKLLFHALEKIPLSLDSQK